MFLRVWEYDVRPGRQAEFVSAYGGDGDWARLFARHPGWRSTELFASTEAQHRFVTVDRWSDESSWREFLHLHRAEYEALDGRLEALTVAQRELAPAMQTDRGSS